MKTKQLIVRSAVTLVTTGLTLLSVSTSQASGRGSSGMRMSGGHGSMNRGAMRQAVSNRATTRVQGTDKMNGRIHDKTLTSIAEAMTAAGVGTNAATTTVCTASAAMTKAASPASPAASVSRAMIT
nr:hypothetical protein [Blastocatellia bacterium]